MSLLKKCSNLLDNKLLKVNKNSGLMIFLQAFLLRSCSSKQKIKLIADYFKVFENFLETFQITQLNVLFRSYAPMLDSVVEFPIYLFHSEGMVLFENLCILCFYIMLSRQVLFLSVSILSKRGNLGKESQVVRLSNNNNRNNIFNLIRIFLSIVMKHVCHVRICHLWFCSSSL